MGQPEGVRGKVLVWEHDKEGEPVVLSQGASQAGQHLQLSIPIAR